MRHQDAPCALRRSLLAVYLVTILIDRTTLKDVAREAGVHVSTASRALNPATASVVNQETVERVTAAARSLGYRPHLLARGLRTSRTMAIGMVVPDVENPLFGPIIAGVESVLIDDGYSVVIGNADRGRTHADTVISGLLDRHVDGVILATAANDSAANIRELTRGAELVLVNRAVEDESIPAIVVDDHVGIGLAVRHLVGLGHRRIGHVAGPSWVSTGLGRRQSFLAWLSMEGIEADPDLIEEADWYQVQPGELAATALLERRPDLTAIVAANDLLAVGCYRAVRARGLDVPGDVSVTGYNDIPLVDMLQPAMTTVRVPYRQMGMVAASTMLSLLGGESDVASMSLAPALAQRASTAPPPDDRTR